MYIEPERLIVRELEPSDADALLKIKYDAQVLEFDPEFIKRNATESDAAEAIAYCIRVRDSGDFSREMYYAAALRGSGELAGVITVSELGYLREMQMGWMFRSEFCGHGYASEAARAVSDNLLRKYGWPYLAVVMDADNPASYRTAQKSGFRLFEKRAPYDYYYSRRDVENIRETEEYFAEKQAKIGSCYYCFRKYHPDDDKPEKFYGDTLYTGRFA